MSDSNNEVEHYDWKAAWKLDDPEWVKERKKKWHEIKSHYILYMYNRRYLKMVQNYFLTGTAFPDGNIDSTYYDEVTEPLPVEASLFIKIWLHPTVDTKAFDFFKKHTDDVELTCSRNRFRECLSMQYPDQGGMFGELDEVIYKALGPCRARPEDFPKLDEEKYNTRCSSIQAYIHEPVIKFLSNPYSELNIAPLLVPEWLDAIEPAIKYRCKENSSRASMLRNLTNLIELVIKVLDSEDDHHPEQVKVANTIISTLKSVDYPPKTKRFTDYLAKLKY